VYKNRIIAYGGNTDDGFVNDVWQFDTKLNSWSKLDTRGVKAPASAYHSAVVVGNHMWVFGGRNDKSVLGDEVYVLDLDILTWQKPLLHGKAPSKRHGANVAVYKNRYVFLTGGCDISVGKCYDDTFTLDTVTQTWVRPVNKDSVIVNAHEAAAVGVAPAKKPTSTHKPAAKPAFLELESAVDAEAELDLEADELAFIQIDQATADSSAALTSDVRRVGNTLYVSDLSKLDDFFANMNRNRRAAAQARASEAATGEMSFADSANATAPNTTTSTPTAPIASAPAASVTTNATASTPAPTPAPVQVANATVANTTVAHANATVATNTTTPKPVQNVTVAHVKPVTISAILKQTNVTVPKTPKANLTGIVKPHAVSHKSLPKILGLKGMVDAEAAKQKLKKEVEAEKKKTDAITAAHFTPVLRPPAGADFVGSFQGDQLVLFGGCSFKSCAPGVLVMHVDPKSEFQMGLY
jgi:hypothetical protein